MATMDSSQATAAAAVAVSVSVLYLAWHKLRRHLESKVPFEGLPMPSDSHWLFGHLGSRLFGSDFRRSHKMLFCDSADEYGICSFWMMNRPGVSVTRWEDAKAVLQASTERRPLRMLLVHVNRFTGLRNIVLMNGKEWKYHRAAILRVFHSTTTLQNSRAAMVDVAQTLVKSLRELSQPVRMDMAPVMKMITMDVFGKTALSYDFACCERLEPSPMAKAFDFLGADMLRRLRNPMSPTNTLYDLPTAANRRNAQERKLIRDFLQQLIEERRQLSPEDRKPDLLTSLLRAHEEMKEQAPQQVTDMELVDMMMSLLFAGYDTTSITLTYALYNIASSPDAEKHCLDEIKRVWRDDGNVDPEQLVYCTSVITETLRLYPPAVVTNRHVTKPLQLSNGFIVPENTFVAVPIYIIHHDPRHFVRPDEFLPERWVVQKGDGWVERAPDDSSDIAGNRNALFAFSAGARSCAGQKFAIQEAVLVMATLLKELKFAVEPDYVLEPHRNGIIQCPKNGMPMIVTSR